MYQYKKHCLLITEAADKSVQDYSTVSLRLTTELHCKGQLPKSFSNEAVLLYTTQTLAHISCCSSTHTESSHVPACQSCGVVALWWLISSTQCPHTISQREENLPSSILIFFSSIFISSFIFIALSRLESVGYASVDHRFIRQGGGLSWCCWHELH